jgi:hypothetical protein
MQNWSFSEVGDCLVCSEGNEWLQTGSNRLFVRPCYHTLFQDCQVAFEGNIQGIFLVGTPGIGKSAFLDFALCRFLQPGGNDEGDAERERERSVLYLSGPTDQAFVFHSTGVVEEHSIMAALRANIAKNVHVVLYDPHENADRTNDIHLKHFQRKRFIVAMSPDEKNCKKLRKDTRCRATRYMGTFSLSEAEALISSCYPDVSMDLLHNRYLEIGGIVRHLIRPLSPFGLDEAIVEFRETQTEALDDVVENPRRIDGGEVASGYKHLWSLYHLQPASPADGMPISYGYTIELCCNDVRFRIRDLLMKSTVQDLWSVYAGTRERHGTLRGIRYEAYAHKKILVEGINGTAISLTSTGEGVSTKKVSIPPRLNAIGLPSNDLGAPFKNAVRQARKCRAGGYLLPESSNFPVIDSLFTSVKVTYSLQMKAGRSKLLSGMPAASIHATAGGCLVFLVPDGSILGKKLAYVEGDGPSQWRQYRLVLKEPN